MRLLAFISLGLTIVTTGALACSPGYVDNPGSRETGALCSFTVPDHVGAQFAEPAMDRGNGRVTQVVGYGNGCDINSSVVVTQCTTSRALTIGHNPQQGQPNGGGWLFDVKTSLAPDVPLDLTADLADLAAHAARNGQDVSWMNGPMGIPKIYGDWSFFACACKTFYPDSEWGR